MIDEKYNGSSKWKGAISVKLDQANFEIPSISEVYLRIYKLCKCKEIKSIIISSFILFLHTFEISPKSNLTCLSSNFDKLLAVVSM